jgi:hypothetical protein
VSRACQLVALGMALACIALLIAAVTVAPVHGHDHARPDLDGWYHSLQSRKGLCCGPEDEYAALNQLDGFDWKMEGGNYKVFVDGRWLDVPPEAVIDQPNKAGRALVWLYHFQGEPIVRCFMPGAMI